jgi:hypothetical protein
VRPRRFDGGPWLLRRHRGAVRTKKGATGTRAEAAGHAFTSFAHNAEGRKATLFELDLSNFLSYLNHTFPTVCQPLFFLDSDAWIGATASQESATLVHKNPEFMVLDCPQRALPPL